MTVLASDRNCRPILTWTWSALPDRTRAGKLISKSAADTLKRVHLELGGKGANLIFADADEKAVKRGVLHMMQNTGQSCNAPSRMMVEASIYDQTVEAAATVADKITVGPADQKWPSYWPRGQRIPMEQNPGLDPNRYRPRGRRLVAGGTGRPDGLNKGFYVRPTVFADVTTDMTIAKRRNLWPGAVDHEVRNRRRGRARCQ